MGCDFGVQRGGFRVWGSLVGVTMRIGGGTGYSGGQRGAVGAQCGVGGGGGGARVIWGGAPPNPPFCPLPRRRGGPRRAWGGCGRR